MFLLKCFARVDLSCIKGKRECVSIMWHEIYQFESNFLSSINLNDVIFLIIIMSSCIIKYSGPDQKIKFWRLKWQSDPQGQIRFKKISLYHLGSRFEIELRQ